MKEQNKATARNIKNYMDAFGYNQVALAVKLGCTSATVSTWLLGDSCPRIEKIDAMCRLFGCERKDIVGEEEKSINDIHRNKRISDIIEMVVSLDDEKLDLIEVMLRQITHKED